MGRLFSRRTLPAIIRPEALPPQGPCGGTQDEDVHSQDDYRPPTVESRLYQAYRFNRDFRVRGIPPFPEEEYRKADARKKRMLSKTHAYRAKRSQQSEDTQRQLKLDAIVRRSRKAAAAGRVHFVIRFLSFLFAGINAVLQRVVRTNEYSKHPRVRKSMSPLRRGNFLANTHGRENQCRPCAWGGILQYCSFGRC